MPLRYIDDDIASIADFQHLNQTHGFPDLPWVSESVLQEANVGSPLQLVSPVCGNLELHRVPLEECAFPTLIFLPKRNFDKSERQKCYTNKK